MRKKYVAYYKGCTIEVTGEKDFMYRIIKGERMVLFVDMFYRSTTDALKGAMRWVTIMLERSDFMLFGIVFAMIMRAICGNMLDD